MSVPGLDRERWGFGGAGIGSLGTPVAEDVALATVDAAWDAGARFFDTAPHYGLGLSEERLGAALATRDRTAFAISTKVGRLVVEADTEQDDLPVGGFAVRSNRRRVADASAEGVARSLADSRRRLGIEHLDIAFLHDPEEDDLEEALASGLPALVAARDAGGIDRIGVGSKSVAALLAAVRTGIPDVIMLAGRYNLLDRSAAGELLPLCVDRGVDVIAVGVLASGALAHDVPDPSSPYQYGPMPPDVYERLRQIAAVCRRHEVPLPAAALGFPTRHAAVSGILVGAQSPEQVRENAARAATAVPDALWEALASEGML